MALETEFVAKADEYDSIVQTVSGSSTSVYIPDGVWMCSLTGTVSIGEYTSGWIRLDGVSAGASTVSDTGYGPTPTASVGVVVPSFRGGRGISIESNISRTMNFYAAKIGY